jgi:thiosulfate reductase/polysulfide reductase chain A
MEKLEFIAVVDVMPMEQVNYADLVLPEATYLERYDPPHIATTTKQPFIAVRQPVVEPMYESKPGWWIAKQLARRLGLEAYFPWTDPEQQLEAIIQPMSVNKQALRNRGAVAVQGRPYIEDRLPSDGPLFPTASGKIELYSSALKDAGFDPLPQYTPHADPPLGYFRLLDGRSPLHSFARTQNNALLNSLDPENAVWISAKAARELGLLHGQKVVLENQDGIRSLPVKVAVTEGIRRDCVYMVHGFGHRSKLLRKAFGRGASDTGLMTRVEVDPIMGATGMRVNFVRVLRQEQG